MKEMRQLPDVAEYRELGGVAEKPSYVHHVTFTSWRAYQEARRILNEERREFLSYGSASKQFLIASGITLFKGMAFPDIRRMQVDIETTDLSFAAEGACIFLIVASDNRGHEEVLVGPEHDILEALNGLVQEWDPDVIEGHNLYAFDLPWIRARAEANGVKLCWGRDSSEIQVGTGAQLRHRGEHASVYAALCLGTPYHRYAFPDTAVRPRARRDLVVWPERVRDLVPYRLTGPRLSGPLGHSEPVPEGPGYGASLCPRRCPGDAPPRRGCRPD
jgi:hypothetical protein